VLMVVPNEGKLKLLEWAFQSDAVTLPGLFVALYTNNYTPVPGSTFGDFTPATFTGSAPIPIARADWDAPAIVSDIGYIEQPDPPAWTCSGAGPETCYGWYCYTDDDDTVLLAQKFDTPRVMSVGSTEALDPFKIALKTLD